VVFVVSPYPLRHVEQAEALVATLQLFKRVRLLFNAHVYVDEPAR
jgi:hypothetical protein